MARSTINMNLNVGGITPQIIGAAAVDVASVVSANATLVADGASPTQAHVTTLNTAVTALNAAIGSGDVCFIFDASKITTTAQPQSVFTAITQAAKAGYFGALS